MRVGIGPSKKHSVVAQNLTKVQKFFPYATPAEGRHGALPTSTLIAYHRGCTDVLSTHATHLANAALSPVSIETQSLALRKRKPQEMQALAFVA